MTSGDRSAVVDYDPSWPAAFEDVSAAVGEALAGIPHVIEHVGSTAVPGLAAKPIIDLLAIVRSPSVLGDAIEALDRNGWKHEGDGGISGRERFIARSGLPYHHLYLVVEGDVEPQRMIRFRDHLRRNKSTATQYAELKQELAPLLRRDRDAYTHGKTALIDGVLADEYPDA